MAMMERLMAAVFAEVQPVACKSVDVSASSTGADLQPYCIPKPDVLSGVNILP